MSLWSCSTRVSETRNIILPGNRIDLRSWKSFERCFLCLCICGFQAEISLIRIFQYFYMFRFLRNILYTLNPIVQEVIRRVRFVLKNQRRLGQFCACSSESTRRGRSLHSLTEGNSNASISCRASEISQTWDLKGSQSYFYCIDYIQNSALNELNPAWYLS